MIHIMASIMLLFFHHRNARKQYHRHQLYDTLKASLHSMQDKPHTTCLLPYIQMALRCLQKRQAFFNKHVYIVITNKDVLINIIYFLSKRDNNQLQRLPELLKKI